MGITLHVSDRLIHHQVYTDLTPIGKSNSYYNISYHNLIVTFIL